MQPGMNQGPNSFSGNAPPTSSGDARPQAVEAAPEPHQDDLFYITDRAPDGHGDLMLFREIIMIAPDIDADVFRKDMATRRQSLRA